MTNDERINTVIIDKARMASTHNVYSLFCYWRLGEDGRKDHKTERVAVLNNDNKSAFIIRNKNIGYDTRIIGVDGKGIYKLDGGQYYMQSFITGEYLDSIQIFARESGNIACSNIIKNILNGNIKDLSFEKILQLNDTVRTLAYFKAVANGEVKLSHAKRMSKSACLKSAKERVEMGG